jgi:hypothetical protein
MKKLFWKFRYARYLKKKLQLTMRQALDSAESMLENIDYDLNEDPIEMAKYCVKCINYT